MGSKWHSWALWWGTIFSIKCLTCKLQLAAPGNQWQVLTSHFMHYVVIQHNTGRVQLANTSDARTAYFKSPKSCLSLTAPTWITKWNNENSGNSHVLCTRIVGQEKTASNSSFALNIFKVKFNQLLNQPVPTKAHTNVVQLSTILKAWAKVPWYLPALSWPQEQHPTQPESGQRAGGWLCSGGSGALSDFLPNCKW